MSSAGGAALLLCAATALLLGCAGSRTSPDTPAGLSLAGTWKLDPAASDDPQKTLAQMRAQAQKLINRYIEQHGDGSMPPPEPAPGAAPAPVPHGPKRDPLQRSPAAHIIQDWMARGELLTVRQSAGEIVFDFGNSTRSFRPGAESVVSTENGVGDQRSGWSGHGYLIVVKAQMGPEVKDDFVLSADGKQLLETLHIGAYELPAVTLKRVYNLATANALRTVPTSD